MDNWLPDAIVSVAFPSTAPVADLGFYDPRLPEAQWTGRPAEAHSSKRLGDQPVA